MTAAPTLQLTDVQLDELRALRDEIRRAEGGSTDPAVAGGQCGVISDSVRTLDGLKHLTYVAGRYITDADQLVYDHCFNVTPDGTILDVTADQFDEGDDVRILTPTDPRHAQYLNWDDFDVIDRDLRERAAHLLGRYRDGAERLRDELKAVGSYVYMNGERPRFGRLLTQLAAAHPQAEPLFDGLDRY